MRTLQILTLVSGLILLNGSSCDSKKNSDTNTTAAENTSIIHNGTTYNFVTSPYTGKVWLDRNLGAHLACTSSFDSGCQGDYYQWGRGADGHEKRISTVSNTQLTSLDAISNQFITELDWVIGDSFDLPFDLKRASIWSKIDGTSICPVGFRVPNIEELEAETSDANTPFQSNFLHIPLAGFRGYYEGYIHDLYTGAYLWSVSFHDYAPKYRAESTAGAFSDAHFAGNALPVRCIKN